MVDDKSVRQKKLANILFIGVLITIVIIAIGILQGANWLLLGMGILNIVFGPVCLVLYLLEIKKGIFNEDEDVK